MFLLLTGLPLLHKNEGTTARIGAPVHVSISAFDLTSINIQASFKDDYEAARGLRKWEYKRPIIALTANAMKDGEENRLDAGK